MPVLRSRPTQRSLDLQAETRGFPLASGVRRRIYMRGCASYRQIIETRTAPREMTMTKLITIFAAIALTLSIGLTSSASAAPEGFNNFDGSACYCMDP
jgi:hypothetical protein